MSRLVRGTARLVSVMAAALIVSALVAVPAHAATVVTFTDANLEAGVRAALAKPTGPITDVDMQSLSSLVIHNDSTEFVKNLEGLQYASNLTTLAVWGGYVTDAGPLTGLTKLEELELDGNQLASIAPLAGLTKLKVLGLSENRISDVTPLAGMTDLADLNVGANRVANIAPLAGLTKLKRLSLYQNRISDIRPVAGLTGLTYLYLSWNKITDLTPVAGLTNLTWLLASDNSIIRITPLAGLTKMNKLWLFSNRIADIGPLSGMTSLGELRLEDNDVTNVGALRHLNELTNVSIRNNRIADIAPLEGLSKVEWIDVARNYLEIWPGSPDLTVVRSLQKSGTHVVCLPQNPPPRIVEHGILHRLAWGVAALRTTRVYASANVPGMWLVIDVLDHEGVVRKLYDGPAAAPGVRRWTLPWDGRDARGRRLPNGNYRYRVRFTKGPTTRLVATGVLPVSRF